MPLVAGADCEALSTWPHVQESNIRCCCFLYRCPLRIRRELCHLLSGQPARLLTGFCTAQAHIARTSAVSFSPDVVVITRIRGPEQKRRPLHLGMRSYHARALPFAHCTTRHLPALTGTTWTCRTCSHVYVGLASCFLVVASCFLALDPCSCQVKHT